MKKILLGLLVFLGLNVVAQKGGLAGRVLDETKQPLPGASIIVTETKYGTATNFNGFYELLNIKTGTYNISVSFIGYQTLTEKIEITKGLKNKIFRLMPKTNSLNEVVIQGSIAKGQAKALNKQKSNDNITNVISSDQVGKFPDSNIGDALKRVSGIAMQNDQGEARDIIVRGLSPQLNSVTLNGDRMPSAEGDNRRVQMDLIPSDMIQTIEVSKAVTPDMEADAIGGSVNLVTRSAPSAFRASLTSSYGGTKVRNGTVYAVSGVVAGRTKNGKLGAVFNGSLNSSDYGSDNIEFEWDSPTKIKEHDVRKYDVKRVRKSVGLNLDWKPSQKHSFAVKSMYNTRNDLENRYRLRYKLKKGKYTISRQTKGGIDNDANNNRRLEKQTTYKVGLEGKHVFFSNVKVDWKVSKSKAQEKRPDERYITFKSKLKEEQITQKGLTTRKPYFVSEQNLANDRSAFELDEVSEENQYTHEEKLSSKLNVKIPITNEGDYQNYMKFGYKHKAKTKLRDNTYQEFDTDNYKQYNTLETTPNSNETITDFLAGNDYKSGYFATNEFLGKLALKDGEQILGEFVPKNYNATEDIAAFYIMLKQELGSKLSFVTGLRAENTNVDYTGYAIDVETAKTLDDVKKTSGKQSYLNLLPNFQLKYKPIKNLLVRTAWTNTIARPNYYDLVPYENINSEDEEAAYGNPNLEATRSMNLDLMAEYYFANVGILSFGGFHKNITNFIYEKTAKEKSPLGDDNEYDVTRVFNGGKASIYGFEFSLQRKLNFLPGFLRNLTFYGNYTYTGSKTSGIEGREEGLALSGAIKHMANSSLAYETRKLTVRGSLNFANDYIDEYGSEAFKDRYYDKQTFVDVNASYEVLKGLRIFVEAKNLTNQELRFYQGEPGLTMQAEYYGYSWNGGLKYNF